MIGRSHQRARFHMTKPHPHASSFIHANSCGVYVLAIGRWSFEGRRYCPIVKMSVPTRARSRNTSSSSSSLRPTQPSRPILSPDSDSSSAYSNSRSVRWSRPGTNHAIEPRNALGIVIQHFRSSIHHDTNGIFLALEVGDQHFHLAARSSRRISSITMANARAPPVISSSRFTLVITAGFKP